MARSTSVHIDMPLGVVIRRSPGVTAWARWSWRAVAVLPGAGAANWTELRREGEVVEYHAATLPLTLWAAEAEAYLANLSDRVPSVYVVLRDEAPDDAPFEVVLVTASPYEGQDYADNGEDVVEKVAMPGGLIAWMRDFAQIHRTDQAFIKRRRDRVHIDRREDGKGDARIAQTSDVFRAPKRVLQ